MTLRGGHVAQRRRRVLLEEGLQGTDVGGAPSRSRESHAGGGSSTGKASSRPGPHGYASAAREENQPRLTDLIPRRRTTICGLLLAGGLMIAGLLALDHYRPAWEDAIGSPCLACFDMTHGRSLARWFEATSLTAAAIACIGVYALRRYKEDDYRGRYRVWLWAAAAAWLAGVASVVDLRPLVFGLAELALREHAAWTGPAVLGVISAFLTGLLLALLYDLRHCRPAVAALVFSAGAVVAIPLMRDRGAPVLSLSPAAVAGGLTLAASLLFVIACLANLRSVFLEAQGVNIQSSRSRRRNERKAATPRQKESPPANTHEGQEDAAEPQTERPKRGLQRLFTRRGASIGTGDADSSGADESSQGRVHSANSSGRLRVARLGKETREERLSQRKTSAASRPPAEPGANGSQSRPPAAAASGANDPEAENEILRLEAMEPHLLSKAQRRRLKKLKRRHGRAAA